MINRYEGETFLNRIYKDLHLSDEVMHTATKSDNKDEKVHKYLNRLEKIENMTKESRHNGIKHLKNLYYKKYVIKPENVPESYFELQKKIALERGNGYINIGKKEREEMIKIIIEEQKKSLDIWLDYLIENDAMYPEWFKYYAFQGMQKLGSYDKEKGNFNKRTDSTTSVFIDLNYEALALTYDNLCAVLGGNKLDDDSLQKLIENGSFAKIYGYFIKKIESRKQELLDNNDGIWIKYDEGSKPDKLVESLQGKRTGWCTAGYETAKKQLFSGDFYVYYTKDGNNTYSQPRIAIRMEGDSIGEIRGIAKQQNLEPEMEGVLSEKLKEFPDREKYLKKVSDMEKLTKIHNEYEERELTKEEIKFLYEIDNKIVGFGYGEDPRIDEVRKKRNLKKDLSFAFDCSEDEISDNEKDVLNGKKIVYFYGDLYLNELKNAAGLILPQSIGGHLYLDGLTNADGLVLPQSIGGHLYLDGLTNAEGLVLPQSIGRDLYLEGLTSADGLVLPQSIGGHLYLDGLTNADGLVLPQSIGGSLYLRNLTSADGLVLPQSIGGSLYLRNLTSADGLVFPQSIGNDLSLSGLTSADGLVLPQSVGGSLYLDRLTSADGLVLPQSIGGSLYLRNLTSVNELVLPQSIGNDLCLDGLTSADGLVLPQRVGDSLYLWNLTSIDGLRVPKNFTCDDIVSPYIPTKDLINKSLENTEDKVETKIH